MPFGACNVKRFLLEDTDMPMFRVTEIVQYEVEADDAAESLGSFLRAADDARDVWYLYRSDRLHEYMQSWLDGHEIKAIDPPPWA